MSPLSKEWQYPAIMGAVAAFFLLLFYLDYSRTIDIGSREAIGYITYKNNRVQRKFEDQVVWSNLENNSPLTNRDTIRSENLADAVIHLNDGTIIKIDENSMFFLDLTGASPKLSFHTGSIQIQQGENGKTEFVIQTGGRTINVDSGSDLKIEGAGADQLSVLMQRGNASIHGENGTQAIGADQRARLTEDGISIREINMKLLEPANQGVVTLDSPGETRRVPFRWELREQFSGLTFELSRLRNFSQIETRAAAGESGTVALLKAGSFYWRLRGKNRKSGQEEISEIRKISVVPNSAVSLSTPARGEKISYVVNPPLINFSWTRNELANQYILEVASDGAFKTNVRKFPVTANAYGVPDFREGTYFWRVRSTSLSPGIQERVSGTASFVVVKKDTFDVPQPGTPSTGGALAEESAGKGVTFAWRAPEELNRFRVQISRDPSFSDVIVDREVSQSYLENPVAETGTYYWRVKGGSGSKESSYSTSVRFEVLNAEQLAAREKSKVRPDAETVQTAEAERRKETERQKEPERGPTMVAVAPVDSQVNVSGVRSIAFTWKAARGAPGYQFRLYRGAGAGRKLVLEKNLSKPGYTLTDFTKLDVGVFSWEVKATRGSEEIGARFTIVADSRLNNLRPEDIEFISPDTIYKE